MTDRFEDIRTFVAVVDGQTFRAAAERLDVVKSAVSRRIRDLEERLGTHLIDRSTRRLRLTQTGADFYGRCVQILKDLEDAEAGASLGSREVAGQLRITAPVSFSIHCLAPVVCEFLANHPRLKIEIDTNDRVIDLLAEGFDLAIRISVLKDSRLMARRITTIRHVACASPAYLEKHGTPRTPADLNKHRGIDYAYVEPKHYWMFRGNESVAAKSALSMSNGDAIREAAIAGYGVVVLPSFIVHKAIERGELRPILKDFMRPPIALHAVHAANRNVPGKVRLFIDFLANRFGNEPFWDAKLGLSSQ